jgi:Ca2+-transporting ATPase
VVFEAEPLEADAMAVPPRPASAHFFDRSVLLRGLWQGLGLLVLLLAVYATARMHSEGVARALVFSVLVLSNLGLIYANRSWTRPSWRKGAARNRYFGWTCAATVLLLGTVLGFAPVRRLFAFDQPAPWMLLAAFGLAAVSLLWFEAVKWAMGRPAQAIRNYL